MTFGQSQYHSLSGIFSQKMIGMEDSINKRMWLFSSVMSAILMPFLKNKEDMLFVCLIISTENLTRFVLISLFKRSRLWGTLTWQLQESEKQRVKWKVSWSGKIKLKDSSQWLSKCYKKLNYSSGVLRKIKTLTSRWESMQVKLLWESLVSIKNNFL